MEYINTASSSTSSIQQQPQQQDPQLKLINESNVKPYTFDLVKEFKANGNFDRFRRECFNEIISQQSFESLKNEVDDYVKKILKDQQHNAMTLNRKNDLRDNLRRKLNESNFLTNGINNLVNQIINVKIENSFKPIINEMVTTMLTENNTNVETMTTVSKSDNLTTSENTIESTEQINNNISTDNQEESNNTNIHSEQNKQPNVNKSAKQQNLVKVEDFLNLSNSIKQEKQQIVLKSQQSIVNTTVKKDIKLTNKTDKKLSHSNKLPINKNSQQTVSSSNNSDKLINKLPITQNEKQTINTPNIESFEFIKNISFIDDPPLNPDPQNIYNFDWKLNQIESQVDKNLLDNFSLNSNDEQSD